MKTGKVALRGADLLNRYFDVLVMGMPISVSYYYYAMFADFGIKSFLTAVGISTLLLTFFVKIVFSKEEKKKGIMPFFVVLLLSFVVSLLMAKLFV